MNQYGGPDVLKLATDAPEPKVGPDFVLIRAEAGGLPLAGLTAYQALAKALGVNEDDTVLIHAASGGVGSLAVQIAVAKGARVIGTASARNHDYLRELGAEPVEYGDGLVDRV